MRTTIRVIVRQLCVEFNGDTSKSIVSKKVELRCTCYFQLDQIRITKKNQEFILSVDLLIQPRGHILYNLSVDGPIFIFYCK